MTKDMNPLFKPDFIATVQMILYTGWISVYADPKGQVREYSVETDDNNILMLACDFFADRVEYSIIIDEEVIVCVPIMHNQKIHTPEEQIILSLFRLCTSQVIAQELRNRVLINSTKTRA